MTFILRHEAQNKQIAIRSDGYVKMQDLLNYEDKGKLAKVKLTEYHIRAEVQLNEKQRFELSEIEG